MEINIRESSKIVEVWLTSAEQEDTSISARLKLLYAKYRNTNYSVVVFKSGKKDLYQGTLDLIMYNRKRSIENG